MTRIHEVKVALVEPRPLEEITEASVHLYLTAQTYTLPIYDTVKTEFEEALLADVRVDRRKKKQSTDVNSGDVDFTIDHTKGERTAYGGALDDIQRYLEYQLQCYAEGKRPTGVLSIKDEPHMSAEELKERVKMIVAQNTSASFTKNIKYDAEASQEGDVRILRPGSYHELTTRNAEDYIFADEQTKLVKKFVVEPFRQLVKGRTGFSKEERPEHTTVYLEQVGDTLIKVVTAPKEDVKYRDILNELQGDIETMSGFETSTRDGVTFVSIPAVLARQQQITTRYTGKNIQQDIHVGPLPYWDTVITAR
jgi:hypothetical protein